MHRTFVLALCLALLSVVSFPMCPNAAEPAPDGWERTEPPLERLPPRDEPRAEPGGSPLQGVRDMLRTMDALIEAFQEESETFTRLLDVYRRGGEPWQKLERCIDQSWRESKGEEPLP